MEAYVWLKNCEFSSTQNAEEINNLLYWLNKTNNYDWMPPAIKFFADNKNDSAYILWFIEKLERLASYLLVTEQDVNDRMNRYKWILVEMESRLNHNLNDPSGYLSLRNQLANDGVIIDGIFQADYTFTSISAAASVVLGRTANGRTEWTKIDGRTFAQVGC